MPSRTESLRTIGEIGLEIPVEVLVRSKIEQLDRVATLVELISEKPLVAVDLELHDADAGQRSRLRRAEERIFDELLNLIVELSGLRLRFQDTPLIRSAESRLELLASFEDALDHREG